MLAICLERDTHLGKAEYTVGLAKMEVVCEYSPVLVPLAEMCTLLLLKVLR
jgi:hypothetical protein